MRAGKANATFFRWGVLSRVTLVNPGYFRRVDLALAPAGPLRRRWRVERGLLQYSVRVETHRNRAPKRARAPENSCSPVMAGDGCTSLNSVAAVVQEWINELARLTAWNRLHEFRFVEPALHRFVRQFELDCRTHRARFTGESVVTIQRKEHVESPQQQRRI